MPGYNPDAITPPTTPWSLNWLTHPNDATALTDLGFSAYTQTLPPAADSGALLRLLNLPVYNTADYATVNALVAAAGVGPYIIHASTHRHVTANLALGAGIHLVVDPGILIEVDNAVTFTINSPEHVHAGALQQLFTLTGTGLVAWTNGGQIPSGWFTNLAAAVASAAAGLHTIIVSKVETIAANLAIPGTVHLIFTRGGSCHIEDGFTLTLGSPDHYTAGLRQQIFSRDTTGNVAFTMFGTFLYVHHFGALGNNVTNDYAALQWTLDIAHDTMMAAAGGCAQPVFMPAGVYLLGTKLQLRDVCILQGAGKWATVLKAGAGFAGVLVQDDGSAAKIRLRDFQINAVGEANVTDLLNLGTGAAQWGTEGEISHVMLRGDDTSAAHHNGQTGLRVSGNAAPITDLSVWDCEHNIFEAANCTAIRYDGLWLTNFTDTGRIMEIQYARVHHAYLEIGFGGLAMYVNRSVSIGLLEISSAGLVHPNDYYDQLIEIDAAAVNFSAQAVTFYDGGGTATLNQLIKDNRTVLHYWGDPTPGAAGNRYMQQLSDRQDNDGGVAILQKQQLQAFKFSIQNAGGTLQHKISSHSNAGVNGDYQGKINAASCAWNNTPTGADAATAMAFGGKISSGSTNAFILDTVEQDTTHKDWIGFAQVNYNTTGVSLIAALALNSRDVNGVTIYRPELYFYNATTGAAFALTVGNIGAGLSLSVQILTFFK